MCQKQKIAFRACNNKIVTLINKDNSLTAIGKDVNESLSIFQIEYQNGVENFRILAPNKNYVSNEIGNAIATENKPMDFFFIYVGQNKFMIYVSNDNYLQLDNDKLVITPFKEDNRLNAIFEIVLIEDVNIEIQREKIIDIGKVNRKYLPKDAFTICFCGTGCTRDEGEIKRKESDPDIYCKETGYIPVRIHKEIVGDLKINNHSVTIRGVGERDWASQTKEDSCPLMLDGPLKLDENLAKYINKYSGGKQFSVSTQAEGWSMPALALHAANMAVASGKNIYNFIGHSRGAVEAIMAAWFIFLYGGEEESVKDINIFAIDPVPGPGEWYGIFTQLPPNVANYVGKYAWDMSIQASEDKLFMALVPRPNARMVGEVDKKISLYHSCRNEWKYMADDMQQLDPLSPSQNKQPTNYELYACRGRHSTLAGNSTSDGAYSADKVNAEVSVVPKLVYKIARGYLTKWGTKFQKESEVKEDVLSLRKKLNMFHRVFDVMGGGATRTSIIPLRPYVRRVSSTYGQNPLNCCYMDNVVGNPPYKMAYPVTADRTDEGWVKWKFL